MRYGEWSSTITVDDVLTSTDSMSQVRAVGADVYWLAGLAAEDSRGTIMRWRDEEAVDLTPQANVRSRVNEYGGGTYDVDDSHLAYVDDVTRGVYVRAHGGQDVRLDNEDANLRYGGLRLASDRGYLLAVREDHRAGGEPVTTLVALRLNEPNPDGGLILAAGADFYGRPAYRGGQVAWAQWDHPNMPWDHTTMCVAQLFDEPTAVSSGNSSAVNPLFTEAGELVWLDDSSGFWNPNEVSDPHDYCYPPWTLQESPYAEIAPGRFLMTRIVDGFGCLVLVEGSQVTKVELPTTEIESIAAANGVGYAVVERADQPTALVRVDATGTVTQLVSTGAGPFVSAPESIWFEGPAGKTQAWFYPPARMIEGQLPPLIVRTHGGPTGMALANYSAGMQFWCDRGIAVLDVNYSGSSGFGREYRERLKGQWGVLDVADCVAAVAALEGRIDPTKVAITGGSAGGYTTLQALVSTDVFAAGMSLYGIGDLGALARDTHKFESRYLDGLLGPWPQAKAIYDERSPINHVANLATPMLILQGRDDFVVPLNQAEEMAAAVRAKGLPVALVVFDGEGHGFRQVANRRASLLAQLSFLGQVFGFEPAGEVPKLPIENLT